MIKKQLSVLLGSAALMTSMSGCVIGAATWPFGFPLFMAGTGLAIGGGALVAGGVAGNSTGLASSGGSALVLGTLLDGQNPGHSDSLTTVSQALASRIGVTEQEIKHYNRGLSKDLRQKAQTLFNQVQPQFEKIVAAVKNGQIRMSQASIMKAIEHDPEIQSLAQQYGFRDAEELTQTLMSQHLSRAKLADFASAAGMAEADAQIMLYTQWQIHTE